MAKDTFYFSHDYNVRSDIKIKKLIIKHGYLGYGLFWAILEDLYSNQNSLPIDYDCIAFDLRTDTDTVKSIINDFDLFVFNNGSFGSLSAERRLKEREEKSNRARKNILKRWSDTNEDIRIKPENCLIYCIEIYNEFEKFLKVGITTESVSRRYSGKLNNYNYNLIFSCENTTENCLKLEQKIRENFTNYKPKEKFAGYLECLYIDDLEHIKGFAIQDDSFRNTNFSFRNTNFSFRNTNFNFSNTIKERKGKENKGKESKEDISALPSKFSFYNSLIDYGFKKELVSDWLAVRKTKKATNTQTAFNVFIKEIEKRTCNLNEILEFIVSKNWSGFKWEWHDKECNLSNSQHGKQSITNTEQFKQITQAVRADGVRR